MAILSKGLILKVSGMTENGSLRIYSDKKFELLLSDAQISNPEGAAINILNGNCFVVLEGENTLSDGASAQYNKTNGDGDGIDSNGSISVTGGSYTLISNPTAQGDTYWMNLQALSAVVHRRKYRQTDQ